MRNTLVGRLRPRSTRGRLQAKPKRLFFVILVTHHKSYIETTDRRDFGGKPSEWRWGRVPSWKIPEFCSVGAARSKNSIFRVFGVPFDCHRNYSFTPNQWYRWKAETLKVCLLLVWIESVTRCRKVVTWPSQKLNIFIQSHVEKFTDSKYAIPFDLRRKIMKLSRKNRFRTVASLGAWIDARRQYILLVDTKAVLMKIL